MKKSIFKSIFFIVCSLFIFQLILIVQPQKVFAATTSDGYEYSVSGTTATITRYTGSGGNITIPKTINNGVFNYTVTSIGDSAFYAYSKLTSVTIPDSVTSIGDSAFMASSNITSVTIPNSVTSIGTNSFWGCSSLTSLTIPDSITSIGDSAFFACNNLKSVTIAEGVISIGDSAFSGCNNLTSVTIPNSVTSIGDRAFWSCSKLTNIEVDSSNEYYSSIDGVLFNKSSDSIITFPGGKAGEYIIPSSVTSIGSSAFSYCNNLISVTIPDSVISIGESAFSGSGVAIISIGNKVNSIGLKAFSFCFNLRNIEVEPSNEYYTSINGVLFNKSVHSIIAFPGGRGGTYIIPDTVTSIGDNAFYGCSSLTSVTIPDSVISIGDSAFSDCNGLSGITMGNNVISIGDSAFGYCGYARSVTIPDSVTHIGDRAFEGCFRLISVTIGNGVTSIGDSTFYDCYALTSVTIPEGVTNIGDNAFLFCTSLTSVTIPEGVANIGDHAFQQCTSLTSVTIPDGVTNIGDGTFYNCYTLTSVTIPDSVTNIGYYAFAYCNSLTSVTIPASVTNIDEYAFYNCSMLTSVQFLGNAPTVGSTAFSYSSSKFIVYYLCGKTGFTNPWYGHYKTQKIGIEVTTPPSKVEYTVGQGLDLTGLVVTGYYYDGITEIIPISMINISGFDSSALVKGQVVTITINGKTTTFTVDIIEKTYAVIFNPNGGTTIANQTASNNTTITAPPVPAKTGYTFGGWYKEAGCLNTWDFITDKVTSDTTLYAKWTINNYTVSFYSQGGSEVTSETADYNNEVTAPAEPTKTGYIFGGWYNEASCINAWNFTADKVTIDTTLYAKWTINNYTVSFNSQGGSAETSKTADYNSLITVPTAPTKTGYAFGGWYKETGCINAWNFITDKVTTDTILYAKWVVVAPGIPTSVKAVSSSYNSINISWSGVTGAGGYEVYRATSSAGAYALLATTAAASYNNTGLVTNNTYYYKVRAYMIDGSVKVYSSFSSVVSAKPIPSIPSSVKAVSSSYNSINISWSGVIGASGYEVYRATSSSGAYALLATTAAASYNNTGLATNSTYYYKVRAYRIVGSVKVYSSFSSVVSAKPIPATPTSAKAVSSSYNSIKISWSGVTGASGYQVYRATSSTGAYALLVTTTGVSCYNSGLATNSTYYYKVRAYRIVGSVKVYSNFSSVVSAKPIPATPVNLKATRISSTSIKLTWSGVTGASGYEIYRTTSSTGTYSLIKAATSLYYTNTGLITGRTYYYKIRAYRIVGTTKVYSNWTTVVYAKP